MLKLQTELEGQRASFGVVSDCIRGARLSLRWKLGLS